MLRDDLPQRPLCIYHGNCADGFAAAWVVNKYYNGDVEFVAGFYQTPPPPVDNRVVIIVDFSYKRPIMLEILKTAKFVTVLDHHKSAMIDLQDLQREPYSSFIHFDMSKSGAMLAWDHFFGNIEPPELIKHIQDRDLWKFELPNTREIQASIFSYPYDFKEWDMLMLPGMKEKLVAEGRAIERKHFKDIKEFISVGTRLLKIGGCIVPAVNVPYMWGSDAGHLLCEASPQSPFAAYYWDKGIGREFGLRSLEDGADVSEVAKMYGGGGHAHAAGFRVDFETARGFEI